MGGRRPLRYSFNFAFALFTGNRDYTGMWVRRGSPNLMAGKVVFSRGLLSPIRVVDLMKQRRLLRYNGDSMGTWRDLHDRAKLVSCLVNKLVTILASSGPSGFFWKFVEKFTNFRLYNASRSFWKFPLDL
ncbi:hypothetical protein TNCV_2211061 [Trichonephila clavipes]|nr:hypothetical protein TNCV_2211061 [Trichonephila clavipes]